MGAVSFSVQFIGYSVGNNWMPHPYMKQRPKIWRIRLKILVYMAATGAGAGALCGLMGMSIWGGIQDALLAAAVSGYKCTPGVNCPMKGFSYYLTGIAVFINAGAAAVFIIQPRFFGKKFNVMARIKKMLGFKAKKKSKKKKIGDLTANPAGGAEGGGGAEDEDEDEEGEGEGEEEEEEEGAAGGGTARFRV
jgi:hypothetical protein